MTDIYEADGRIYAVAWSPDGSQLAYGGEIFEEGETFSIVQPEILQPIPTPTPPVSESRREVITDLSWSPDGRYVGVGTGYWDETLSRCSYDRNPNIVLIDNVNQRLKTIRREGFCSPVGVSFSPDSSKLAIATENEEVWDIQAETRISASTIAAFFLGVSWNPSGESILILLDVFNEVNFTPTDLMLDQSVLSRSDLPHPAWFTYGAWSADGIQVATVTDDGRIHIWTPDQTTLDQTVTLTFEGHAAPVKRLAWNPVSGLIASGDDAGNILS